MKFGVWLGWGAEQHKTITESAPTQTAIKLYRNHRGRTINSKAEMKCAANWQQHYVKCACSSSRRHLQHTQIGGTNGNRKNHQQKSQQKKKEILNTPRTIAQLRKQCISSGAGRVLLLSFVGRSDYRLGNMEKNIESQHVIE